MPSLDELQKALINADAAGDAEAASVFAQEISRINGLLEQNKAQLSAEEAKINPTEGMSGMQKFLAGVGKGMVDVGRGAGQMLGLVSQQEIDQAKARDAALMKTGAGIAGNVVGNMATIAPLMLVPGANTVAGAGAVGAVSGALQPTASNEDRVKNMLAGGIGGAVGQGAVNFLGKALKPEVAKNVQTILDAKITPTPGQIKGGWIGKIESAAESIPWVGEGITNAKTRAIHQFNKAALDKALEPIGASTTTIGHEGIVQARKAVEAAYDTAIELVPRVDFGDDTAKVLVAAGQEAPESFFGAIAKIKEMGKTLKPDYRKQLNNLIDENLLKKMTPEKTMSGEAAMTAKNEFARMAREFRKGNVSFDDRQIASALDAVKEEILGAVQRMEPTAKEVIKKADAAHALLMRVEDAATKGVDGIFTPAQLGQSVKKLDLSLRKKGVSQGAALMQDLSNAGRDVLGSNLPNSGTADRMMGAHAINALVAGLGGGIGYAHPTIGAGVLATGALGRAAYTDPAQKALAYALAGKRPAAVLKAGELLKLSAPLGGLAGMQVARE